MKHDQFLSPANNTDHFCQARVTGYKQLSIIYVGKCSNHLWRFRWQNWPDL